MKEMYKTAIASVITELNNIDLDKIEKFNIANRTGVKTLNIELSDLTTIDIAFVVKGLACRKWIGTDGSESELVNAIVIKCNEHINTIKRELKLDDLFINQRIQSIIEVVPRLEQMLNDARDMNGNIGGGQIDNLVAQFINQILNQRYGYFGSGPLGLSSLLGCPSVGDSRLRQPQQPPLMSPYVRQPNAPTNVGTDDYPFRRRDQPNPDNIPTNDKLNPSFAHPLDEYIVKYISEYLAKDAGPDRLKALITNEVPAIADQLTGIFVVSVPTGIADYAILKYIETYKACLLGEKNYDIPFSQSRRMAIRREIRGEAVTRMYRDGKSTEEILSKIRISIDDLKHKIKDLK